jgi:hypothetical protein
MNNTDETKPDNKPENRQEEKNRLDDIRIFGSVENKNRLENELNNITKIYQNVKRIREIDDAIEENKDLQISVIFRKHKDRVKEMFLTEEQQYNIRFWITNELEAEKRFLLKKIQDYEKNKDTNSI